MSTPAAAPTGETALIIECPAAEAAVGRHRARYDWAAGVGVPAHFTVVYPFRPVDALTVGDHERLADLFEAEPAFRVHGSRTAWFADQVLYVPPDDPEPILDLIAAVTAAFPDRPPYGGAHDTVVPHLTVGHDSPVAALQDAERDVLRALPFVQDVTTVALWRGPAPGSDPGSEPGSWRRVRGYALG